MHHPFSLTASIDRLNFHNYFGFGVGFPVVPPTTGNKTYALVVWVVVGMSTYAHWDHYYYRY